MGAIGLERRGETKEEVRRGERAGQEASCWGPWRSGQLGQDLLLLVGFPLLLHNDDQILFALFLELSHLFLGILQLQRHHFYFFPSFINLKQSSPELVGLVQQLLPLFSQKPAWSLW